MRTTVMAVNIEVAMPTEMVTAKPRTGPEPSANSTAMAIRVVRFESRMVEKARLKPASSDATGVLPSLARSEEHTSELQSLMRNLVCRLLLEKKKTRRNTTKHTTKKSYIPTDDNLTEKQN